MEKIRRATLGDIKEIHALLKYYAAKGDLLGRPLLSLYERVREFMVYEEDGRLAGCVALAVSWEDLAEVRSLAVVESFQRRQIGSRLVQAALADARDLGIKKVFTLTYRPDFFKTNGFSEVDKRELPHKIWQDCINCPHFPDCNETALQIEL